MKTLEEVKAHVNVVGYNQLAIHKIEGFLLGNGLLGGDFEMEYMIGESDFDDFRKWFNEETKNEIDWNEFGYGDFIHVEEGMDVLVLSGIYEGKFVGTNGNILHLFEVTESSRPCNEEEIEAVHIKMNDNGVRFCMESDCLIPSVACDGCEVEKAKDEAIKSLNELKQFVEEMDDDDPFKEFASVVTKDLSKIMESVIGKDDDSEYIDKLEIGSKDAIENIIANLHSGECNGKERESVISALEILVELGKMYE